MKDRKIFTLVPDKAPFDLLFEKTDWKPLLYDYRDKKIMGPPTFTWTEDQDRKIGF
jgi:hypothetical protein